MSEQFADFESLLKRALSPVEPPKELEARLEGTLGSLVDMAAEELEAWELRAMRDPRNWVRPVAAAAIGSTRGRRARARAHAAAPPQAPQGVRTAPSTCSAARCATSRAKPGAWPTTSSDPAAVRRA